VRLRLLFFNINYIIIGEGVSVDAEIFSLSDSINECQVRIPYKSLVGTIHGIHAQTPFQGKASQSDGQKEVYAYMVVKRDQVYVTDDDDDIEHLFNNLRDYDWLCPKWHEWHTNIDEIKNEAYWDFVKAIGKLSKELHNALSNGKQGKTKGVVAFHEARRLISNVGETVMFTPEEWKVMSKANHAVTNFHANDVSFCLSLCLLGFACIQYISILLSGTC